MEDRFAHLYAGRARGAQPSAIREICKLIDRPQMKSLAGGWPDPAVFPAREVAEISAAILDTQADKALQYGTTEGFIELRRELAEWSRKEEGIDCHPDDLLILHGSQQGVDLAVRVFVDPGDVVLVGLPTYFGGTGAVTGCGGTLQGVPVDEDGLDMEALGATAQRLAREGQRVKGVYVISNFQNPTGATLPVARRRRLLELAETHDFVIFEDDPYGDLRFEGEKPPSLKALDTHGRVVHVRSLSKTFAPGLRLAWLIGERAAVRKMAIAKQFVDSCTNSLVQLIFLEFLRRGLWRRAIERNIAHYRRKRDVMLGLLERHFPPQVRWNRPSGGFFLFVHLPEPLDATELLAAAVDRQVAFVAGAAFFIDGSGRNTLRLSYSQATEGDIEAAVRVLGELIHQRLSGRGHK